MKTKPVTPYERLLRKYGRAVSLAAFPCRVEMWFYPKARLAEGWTLLDLHERTRAADQLGYDVRLVGKDDGLHVQYVKRFVEPTE